MKKELKKAPDSSSSSSSENDESKLKINVKKEKYVSSNSSNSSEETNHVWKKPKKESLNGLQVTNGFSIKSVKTEPMSDVESISSKRKAAKRKRELSFSEQLDNLLSDTVGNVENNPDTEVDEKLKNSTKLKKIKDEPKAKKEKIHLSQSISDMSFVLNSPALSSTLIPDKKKNSEQKKKNKKKKDGLKSVEDELFNSFLN